MGSNRLHIQWAAMFVIFMLVVFSSHSEANLNVQNNITVPMIKTGQFVVQEAGLPCEAPLKLTQLGLWHIRWEMQCKDHTYIIRPVDGQLFIKEKT